MNGRSYDPVLGRFLQADPFVKAPKNSQSLNRYSYVLNNPLSYTDPSGYSLQRLFDKWIRPIAAIALTIWQPWGASLWAAALTGSVSGWIAAGNLKGALIGAFSGAVFHGIGNHFANVANSNPQMLRFVGDTGLTAGQFSAKIAAHAMAGGVMSELSGGRFGHGFMAAGATQALAPQINAIDRANVGVSAKRVVAAAMIGGTSSAMTGGKFANGAVTGAFSRAFNDELHYDGMRLRWLNDEGKTVQEWDAVSGGDGYQNPAFQGMEDKGPIPEGLYDVRQSELQFIGERSLVEALAAEAGFTAWPGGESAWGQSRVWLSAAPGTDTFGRSGFSIHGGSFPGSAGCVDLTKSMPSFTGRFQSYGRDMRLTVKY